MWELITNNGWAKLSALLITSVLFVLVKVNDYKPTRLTVSKGNVVVSGLPANLQVENLAEIAQRDVVVYVSGPGEMMIEAERQNYQIRLDLSDTTPGEHDLRLQPGMLVAREYVRRLASIQRAVREFSPAFVHVSVDINREMFPVVVPWTMERSGDMVVDATNIRYQPTRIELTGTRDSLDALKSQSPPFMIRCDTVAITDESLTLEDDRNTVYMVTNLPAEIDPPHPDVRVADPSIQQVTAYIPLKPARQ